MSNRSIYLYSHLLVAALFLGGCGGSNTSSLVREFNVAGIDYCNETNQVVQIALSEHINYGPEHLPLVYSMALASMIGRTERAYESEIAKRDDFEAWANSFFDEDALADPRKLNECENIVEIYRYRKELSGESIASEERQIFWEFLSSISINMDYFSGFEPPVDVDTSVVRYRYDIELDWDLLIHYDEKVNSAKVLALAGDDSELKVGDEILRIIFPIAPQGAQEFEKDLESSSITISSLTRPDAVALYYILRHSVYAELDLVVLRKLEDGSSAERRVKIKGRSLDSDEKVDPPVQAQRDGPLIYVRTFSFVDRGWISLRREISKLREEWIQDTENNPDAREPDIIFDLRFNGGGLIDEWIKIAGLFLGPNKPLGYAEFTDKNLETFERKKVRQKVVTPKDSVALKYDKLFILVNHLTASSAELLAQSLQQSGIAYVIGSRSFGKSIVQSVIRLDPERSKLKGQLRVTAQVIHGLNGEAVQYSGVDEDFEFEDKNTSRLRDECMSAPKLRSCTDDSMRALYNQAAEIDRSDLILRFSDIEVETRATTIEPLLDSSEISSLVLGLPEETLDPALELAKAVLLTGWNQPESRASHSE